MHLSPEKEALFPNLRRDDYSVTSEADWRYNCIAHAAGKSDAPWWPAEEGTEGVFWPDGVGREESLDALGAAFGTLGYVLCDNAEPETGFEKVALYADAVGLPTHAARQLPSGAWTSKLGDSYPELLAFPLFSLSFAPASCHPGGLVIDLQNGPTREARARFAPTGAARDITPPALATAGRSYFRR
jgi:hypothetical protein